MKRILQMGIFALCSAIPLQSMQQCETRLKKRSCCSDFATWFYKIGSHFGNNHYAYLAYANASWWLARKILLKEELDTLDAYYPRFVSTINNNSFILYHTPLHVAIDKGNRAAVALLVAAGADKNKKIATNMHLRKDTKVVAVQCMHEEYSVDADKLDAEIKKVQAKNSVGLTAVELAEKCMKQFPDDAQRTEIYELLKD